jgi:phospholipid N-methyltransferase
VVISGLPWAAYRDRLTEAVAAAMDPAGVFTQFTYTWTRWAGPSTRQLAGFRRCFEEVVLTRTIWGNLPPALVHVMRRPRHV